MPSATRLAAGPIAALLLVGAAAGPAAAAPSPGPGCPKGLGIGLLQFPGARAGDPRARAYVIDHVAPGATFSRRLQVCNGTGGPVRVRLYAAAAQVTGGAFVLDGGPADNDLSRSITVDPPTLTLPSGAVGVATARFAIPRDARAGEQYAVIYAQVDGRRGQVIARSRAGIRVYLDIGAGGERPSDFRIDSLAASRTAQGRPQVRAQVRNTGARALDFTGELTLTEGPGALSAGPFPVVAGTTLGIGQAAPVQVVLPEQVTGGPWTATLTLRSGTLERTASARITFPDLLGASGPPVPARQLGVAGEHRVVVPLAIGLAGLLALLLLAAALLASRRRAGGLAAP